MSVYIKGFPLPNNCGACPLRLAWCRERIYMVTRPERCPLVPVSPHGDLIDRNDLLMHRFAGVVGETEMYMLVWNTALEAAAENAPTIIPASEEGE